MNNKARRRFGAQVKQLFAQSPPPINDEVGYRDLTGISVIPIGSDQKRDKRIKQAWAQASR